MFADECCFQVIYFNSKISFVAPIETSLKTGVETVRLRHAVKNAWVRRQTGFLIGFAWHSRAPDGAGILMSSAAEARPEVVGIRGEYTPGTIVVKTNERRLYLILDSGHAVRYPVGVGKSGKQWAGTTRIDGKYQNPAWSPPAEVKRDKPNMPNVIAGGSPHNPMGVAAMTLAGGEYAIHGTNMPGSVGGFVSYGCIRMLNADITDLYQRVSVGTTVTVTR